MSEQPVLETGRLVLRPFTLADAPAVRELAGDYQVAQYTLNIPHPYPEGAAEEWISGHQSAYDQGRAMTWAITARDDGRLLGAIGLTVVAIHRRAEMGYWLAVPYWNQGLMTEAARAVLDFGFGRLGLLRIYAMHSTQNKASGRVMQKAGMVREGCLRQHVLRWDVPHDLVYYGILRDEWLAAQKEPSG
ncbi:MAG: GNAT family N-acetyltransferase [Anaerolineae bacterium]